MKDNEKNFVFSGIEYEFVPTEHSTCEGCAFEYDSRSCNLAPDCGFGYYKVVKNVRMEQLEAKYKEAQSLLDACYEVVELWDCQAHSQIEWKRGWLEGARRHGAKTF